MSYGIFLSTSRPLDLFEKTLINFLLTSSTYDSTTPNNIVDKQCTRTHNFMKPIAG